MATVTAVAADPAPPPPKEYVLRLNEDEAKLIYAVLNSGPVVDAMGTTARERGLDVKGVAPAYGTSTPQLGGQAFARDIRRQFNNAGIPSQNSIRLPKPIV